MRLSRFRSAVLRLPILLFCTALIPLSFAQISLTSAGTAYTQDFNSLATTSTSSTLPSGWSIAEAGTNANATYTAGTGSSNAGDTYSFGASGSSDRALGGLRSGALIPLFGACFTNNTGVTLTRLDISYAGEQWRLGTAGRADKITFEIGLNTTAINSGTYTAVDALSFSSPTTAGSVGALDGNAAANRTVLSGSIASLSITNGSNFCVRWTDVDATGADDGLGVDDFSLTPGVTLGPAGLSVSDVSVVEGNSGTTMANVTVSLSQPAGPGGVTFSIATADGSAVQGSDYIARSLTNQTIPQGSLNYVFAVSIIGDTVFEPNEQFTVNLSNVTGAALVRGQAIVTIQNDDIVPISQIQGIGSESPYVGQTVTTRGIVTARKTNGFFVQTPDAEVDSNPLTSEGIFVFTSSTPVAAAAVGNLVNVSGTVAEFRPSTDLSSPPATELSGGIVVTLVQAGQTLPKPIVLTTADLTPTGGLEQLEKYEGMRVQVNSLTVVGPTDGFLAEANATATSDGTFYGVITGTPRPFREPGLEQPNPLPAGSPCCIPRWDGNPERLRVDSDAQPGTTAINVTTGAVVTNLIGPLDYSLRTYTILPDPATPPTIAGGMTAVPVKAPGADQFTVAGFNMERFFDTVDDPGVSDVALTSDAFQRRLNKASLSIRNILRSPDILAVEEMENLSTLQTLANKVNDDSVLAGGVNPLYVPFLVEGNDVGGIDVGFLVKSSRVTVLSVTQEGKTATYTDPTNGSQALLNDRPPLILQASVQGPNGTMAFPITVIVNHLRSLNDVEDPTAGPRVRAKRRAQAEFLANLVQARQTANPLENLVVLGDFNAFQFNDGLVDVVGTVRGIPTPATQVVLASPDLVNPDLIDAAEIVPTPVRYSYVFGGNAQTLDQYLLNKVLQPHLGGFEYAHSNADFPEVFRNDASRPERLSDHDMPIGYFNFPKADLSVTISANATPVAGQSLMYTVTAKNSSTEAAVNPQVTLSLAANSTLQSVVSAIGWTCTTSTASVTCTKSALAANTTDALQFSVLVNCNVANGATLVATASLSSQTIDPDLTNNTQASNTSIQNPPPVISPVTVDKTTLWPPNGQFETVTVQYSETDNCGAVSCSLSVSSSEPVVGPGDAKRANDWEVLSANQVSLRAERLGDGPGRTYTITVRCVDSAGNASEKQVQVVVPHSRAGGNSNK